MSQWKPLVERTALTREEKKALEAQKVKALKNMTKMANNQKQLDKEQLKKYSDNLAETARAREEQLLANEGKIKSETLLAEIKTIKKAKSAKENKKKES